MRELLDTSSNIVFVLHWLSRISFYSDMESLMSLDSVVTMNIQTTSQLQTGVFSLSYHCHQRCILSIFVSKYPVDCRLRISKLLHSCRQVSLASVIIFINVHWYVQSPSTLDTSMTRKICTNGDICIHMC